MKRVLVGFLAAVVAIGLAASSVEAEKKGKKKAGKAQVEKTPTSDKIAEAMGKLKWGMSKDEMVKESIDKVKEKYRPLVAKTKDAVEEDRLRVAAREELDAIKKGYVEFDGKSTGWDVSFLKGEFTHSNDESMLVVKDGNSQNFYFFIGGKLWKWYKAFDASVFPAHNFGQFSSAVTRRFGTGKQGKAELRPGDSPRQFLEWQDKSTRLRAVDESDFYGFFCLVFEDKGTVEQLARLRSNVSDKGSKQHAMIEAVTGERSENPDDSANIADRISGKIRKNEQAPEEAPADEVASSKNAKGGKGKSKAAAPASSVAAEDDPISGLGL